MSDHRRYRGRHAQPRSQLRRLTVPLLVIALATGAGIGWAMALTSDHGGPTSSTVTARSADPTNAPTTAATLAPTTTAAPPRSTHTTMASTSTFTTLRPSTTQPRTVSLLQQGPARPHNVAALMDVDTGGADGFACWEELDQVRTPTVWPGNGQNPTRVAIAEPLRICLLRFRTGTPIQVTIRSRTGRLDRSIAPPPCSGQQCASEVHWAALPGDPLGVYQVTAVQGGLRAHGRIVVEQWREPRLMVIGGVIDEDQRVTVRPGRTVGIAIAGFRPHRSIGLLFFYTTNLDPYPKRLRFRAWTPVETDASGAAVFHLRTAPSDPRGCYVVNTWPPLRAGETNARYLWASQSSWHQFCLRR
jgi:hypothetical protein